MLDNKITNFHFDKAIENTSSNEILKPYLTKNAEVSKSGLLMNFIYHDIKTQNEKNLTFYETCHFRTKLSSKLQKILKGETDIEDYIKKKMKKDEF